MDYAYDSLEVALTKSRAAGGKHVGQLVDELRTVRNGFVGLLPGADGDGPSLVVWNAPDRSLMAKEIDPEWEPPEYGHELATIPFGDFGRITSQSHIETIEAWLVNADHEWLWLHPRFRWLCEWVPPAGREEATASDFQY